MSSQDQTVQQDAFGMLLNLSRNSDCILDLLTLIGNDEFKAVLQAGQISDDLIVKQYASEIIEKTQAFSRSTECEAVVSNGPDST